jgi:Icc protein
MALPHGRLRVLQLTDVHLFDGEGGTLKGVNTRAALRAVLDDVRRRAWRPDLVLATGDLVHDESPAGYTVLAEMLRALDRPICALAGNHDNIDAMRASFADSTIQIHGSVHNDRWRIVMLNSAVPGEDYGALDAGELARLDETLAQSAESFALICIHHHAVPVGSRWLDTIDVRQADPLFDILKRHPSVRAVLCGHIHQAFESRRNGWRILGSPSTCVQFLPDSADFALDDKPPGYRWLELMPDGEIETEVVWIGEQSA